MVNNYSHLTGGADRHCFELADLLADRGHEVEFLTTGEGRLPGASLSAPVTGETRESIPVGRRPGVALRALYSRPARAAMRALLDGFRPHVLHAHKLYPQLSVSPLLEAAKQDVPIVQTLHDYEFVSASPEDHEGARWDCRESRFQYQLLNSLLFQVKRTRHVPVVDRWVAVSSAVAMVYARMGVQADVLPNFTLEEAGCRRSRSGRDGVLFFGRLTAEKGVHDVLALARALPELPVSVAGYGPLEDYVVQAAATQENVRFLGRLDRVGVRAACEASTVVVMPSRWQEPGPLSCLEALATGTPVVAYDVGGLGEYVRNAGAGVAVRQLSPATLSAAVQQVVELDESGWGRMSQAGIEAIQTVHSPGRYVESVEAVYRAAMADVRASAACSS